MALHQYTYPVVPVRETSDEPTLADVQEEAVSHARRAVDQLTGPDADIVPFFVLGEPGGISVATPQFRADTGASFEDQLGMFIQTLPLVLGQKGAVSGAVVLTIWMAPVGEGKPRPSENPDRTEAIAITAVSADRQEETLAAPLIRSESGARLGDFESFGQDINPGISWTMFRGLVDEQPRQTDAGEASFDAFLGDVIAWLDDVLESLEPNAPVPPCVLLEAPDEEEGLIEAILADEPEAVRLTAIAEVFVDHLPTACAYARPEDAEGDPDREGWVVLVADSEGRRVALRAFVVRSNGHAQMEDWDEIELEAPWHEEYISTGLRMSRKARSNARQLDVGAWMRIVQEQIGSPDD
jgi:hypothetical protein